MVGFVALLIIGSIFFVIAALGLAFKEGLSSDRPNLGAEPNYDPALALSKREEAFALLPYLLYTPWKLEERGLVVSLANSTEGKPKETFVREMRKYKYPVDCISSVFHSFLLYTPPGVSEKEVAHVADELDVWMKLTVRVHFADYAKAAGYYDNTRVTNDGTPSRGISANFIYAYKGPKAVRPTTVDPSSPWQKASNWKLVKTEIADVEAIGRVCPMFSLDNRRKGIEFITPRYMMITSAALQEDYMQDKISDRVREFPVPWDYVRPEPKAPLPARFKNPQEIKRGTVRSAFEYPDGSHWVSGGEEKIKNIRVVDVISPDLIVVEYDAYNYGDEKSQRVIRVGNVHIRDGVIVKGLDATQFAKKLLIGKRVDVECWGPTFHDDSLCSIYYAKTDNGQRKMYELDLLLRGYAWIDNTRGIHPTQKTAMENAVMYAEKNYAHLMPAPYLK